jgi:restriction endonuclease S subunit
MRDGWIEATLREALEPIAIHPNGKDFPLVLSVTEKRGIIPQTEIFKHRIATDDISKYKVLEPMDIAYNPYLLWCGAIGQWKGTEAGVVSPVYECFRVKSNCEPRYLGYIFETGILTNYFDALAIGSIVRRRRTIPSDFIAAPIQLPPLSEQKRIVDLISSVDTYIKALWQQLESTKKSRKAVLRELLTAGGNGWEESTLGELISHSIGGIWGEDQGGGEVDVPVYRQTEFSDSGILTTPAEAIRSVSKSQLKSRTLQEGDILIQKSAGTPNLPGRVVSVPNLNDEVATFSNFLNLLRPNTGKCIPRLAFLIFWDKHQDGRAFEYQRGTNIKNLDLPSYLLETILLPSAPDQKRIVELISTFDDFLAETSRSISLFENLRSGLLSDLLSGTHEIPASYDKVIGAAR